MHDIKKQNSFLRFLVRQWFLRALIGDVEEAKKLRDSIKTWKRLFRSWNSADPYGDKTSMEAYTTGIINHGS